MVIGGVSATECCCYLCTTLSRPALRGTMPKQQPDVVKGGLLSLLAIPARCCPPFLQAAPTARLSAAGPASTAAARPRTSLA